MTDTLTHRRVLAIALPIVLSNATVPLLGAVDTAVVGQMGLAAPIGAVGIGAIILATFYWFFGFLRMGTSGLIAQAKGAGDDAEVAAHLSRALLVAFAAGVALVLLSPLLFALAFSVTPATPEVEALSRQYLTIRIWGAPATIALYALSAWLIATERTRGVLLLQLWQNGLNIALDLWFVLGLDWGVPGVAVATLIAEWTGLALGFWLCRPAFRGGHWRDRARLLNPKALRQTVSANTDIMIRSVVLQAMFTAFVLTGPRFGDVTLAANQVLLQFLEITAYALDGFAFAAETLVGQAFGAKNRSGVRRAAVMTSQWGGGGALLLGLVFFAAGPWIIDLMATAPEVRLEARTYLIWAALSPVIGIAAWMFDGIYIGAMATRQMRNLMLISGLVHGAAMLSLVPLLGNHGLWLALLLSFVARGGTMALAWPGIETRAVA
jgi:multidrug resistance protein, MATE family